MTHSAETLVARFRSVAARYRVQPAIVDGPHVLTYGDLDRVTDDLAARLLAARRSRAAAIGAYMCGRGAAEAVCVWSILKAGLAFSPLDPEAPDGWLAPVLDELSPDVVLADAAHEPRLRGIARDIPVVALPGSFATDVARAGSAPAMLPDVGDDATAWVTYTSGSTGRPKGVVQTRGTVARIADAYVGIMDYAASDRVLVLHPTMTWDLFGAHLTGAALCPFNVRAHGADALAHWIADQGITVWRSFPTTFRAFVQAVDQGRVFPKVRAVHLSGETVTAEDASLVARHFGTAVLHHVFGSAEAGPVAACRLDLATSDDGSRLPLGPPLPGVRVRIERPEGSLCAPGEAGEIVVHSPYVARGYWAQPALTSTAFLTDASARGFRTGDLGVLTAQGVLYHHGRVDGQIKIRGNRVEPEHVEAALRQLDGVVDAAVAAVPGPGGALQLVAMVAAHTAFDLDAESVRAHATRLLPPALVPQQIAVVATLPVTSNGKVDRSRLPMLIANAVAGTERGVAQRATPEEGRMIACWQRVFGQDVRVDDDFLALGGDSLLAVQLSAHVAREFGAPVSLEKLLDAGTPAALVAWLRQR